MSRRDPQLRTLANRLKTERREHHQTIQAKNRELEAHRPDIIFQLSATYPPLRPLLQQLLRAHHAASPLRSVRWDNTRNTHTPTPLETGAPTSRDRRRVEWINRQLRRLTDDINSDMGGKGPLIDDEVEGDTKPQCFNPECPARFRHQPYGTEQCGECNKPFTEYRAPDEKSRCWRRTCEPRGHTGQCQNENSS